MINLDSGQAGARKSIVAAAAVVLGAWCVPVLASSGIEILCPDNESTLDSTAASLVAHTESALQNVLDDDAVSVSALAETSADTIDEADQREPAEEPAEPSVSSPTVTTRLPGVSESALPSFRRQMHRTDI